MIDNPGADRKLLVIGGGGHGKVVIDAARTRGWNPVGVLDRTGLGDECIGVPVIGRDDDALALFETGLRFAVVAIGQNRVRSEIGERLIALGFVCPPIVHRSAVVSPYACVEDGAVVLANAVVNADARIGKFAIVNTGAIVEHDCTIGHGAHVAPRSVMGGSTHIGDRTLFGIGSVARPGTRIDADAVIGAGSVVVAAVTAGTLVMGAPARTRGQGRG
ncbi:acetyltransferase [Brevundimonas nasdae]|uniref:acetyltransferase n=1 Tax=Brevundimonas nasdae TaxID=172043 RepID=UPI00301A3942